MVAASYWSSPAVASKTGNVEALLLYISVGIFGYDLISHARFDWSMITGKRQRRWPQLLYFGTKLIFAIFLSLNVMLFWLETSIDCQAALIAVEFFMGMTNIMSGSLLAVRTVCVYQGTVRKLVTAVLLVSGAGMVAAWMHGVQDVTAIWYTAAASPWNTGACAPIAIKTTYYVKYILTIIFDLLVLGLTTFGIMRMNSSSRIGDVIIKQGLIYFILTLIVNLVITVLTILNLSPAMSLIAATPQSTVCVIVSTRLYRELAEEATSRYISSSQPQHSGGSGSSNGHTPKNSLPSPVSDQFHSSSSLDQMEKGSNRAIRGNIQVIQTREVDCSVVTPDFLQGHPFSTTVPITDRHIASKSFDETRAARVLYPKLFKQNGTARHSN